MHGWVGCSQLLMRRALHNVERCRKRNRRSISWGMLNSASGFVLLYFVWSLFLLLPVTSTMCQSFAEPRKLISVRIHFHRCQTYTCTLHSYAHRVLYVIFLLFFCEWSVNFWTSHSKKDPSVASLVTDQEKMRPVVASAWLGLVLWLSLVLWHCRLGDKEGHLVPLVTSSSVRENGGRKSRTTG